MGRLPAAAANCGGRFNHEWTLIAPSNDCALVGLTRGNYLLRLREEVLASWFAPPTGAGEAVWRRLT